MRKNFQETNLELTFSSKDGIISFDRHGQFLSVAINNQLIFYGGKSSKKQYEMKYAGKSPHFLLSDDKEHFGIITLDQTL
jgi:hypothetical protein